MNGYIVGQLLETITLILLGVCFLVIIISSFYDVWMTWQQKIIQQQIKRLRRHRPHVTIVIYAKDSTHAILECLKSIVKNRYRQFDIVVVNSASSGDTKQQLLRFQQRHPTTHLRIYHQRKETTVHRALQQGYKKSQRGEIVLTLRPDTVISKTFLKESVAHVTAIGATGNNTALLFNEQFQLPQNLAGSLRQFSQVSRQLMRKVMSLLRLGRLPIDEHSASTAMYLATDFMKKTVKKRRYVYNSAVRLQVLASRSSLFYKKRLLHELALFYLFGSIGAAYVTYSLYMAATLQNTALLLVGWLIVVVWYFAAIWSDDGAKIPDKLRLSFVLPSLYFFLYLVNILEVIIRFLVQIYKSIRAIVWGTISFYATPFASFEE